MNILEYFRLDEEPFRLSPSPRFLYLNDQVKQASAKVQYMTTHRTALECFLGSSFRDTPLLKDENGLHQITRLSACLRR